MGNDTKGCVFLLTAVVGLFAVLGLVGFVNGRGHHDAEPATFSAGNCVRSATSQEEATQQPQISGAATHVAATYCTDKSATAKITKIVGEPSACPLDTDDIAHSVDAGTVCTRNLHSPHPGDPGQGGGLLRPGDCLGLALIAPDGHEDDADYQEVSCGPWDNSHVVRKIIGTAQRISGCAHGTRPFAKEAPGVLEAAVDDISPDRDWPVSYPPVFCLSKSTETDRD